MTSLANENMQPSREPVQDEKLQNITHEEGETSDLEAEGGQA